MTRAHAGLIAELKSYLDFSAPKIVNGTTLILIPKTVLAEIEVVLPQLSAENEKLREALKSYLATYADTQSHPTPLQESRVINAARAAISPITDHDAAKESQA